ncbi:MAG: YggT family protein [Actinomycetota bacterium]|jgi:YggT family protein
MNLLLALIQLYSFVIIARAISSFFPISPSSPFAPIVDILYRLTEPVFAPVRRVLPPMGGLDLAPLVVLLVLNFIIVPILV